MHPFIIKDEPISCPICGMELIKKTNSAPAEGGTRRLPSRNSRPT
ncbi:MAG: heavy metal-binding domain-containing protein [Desulfobacterales bacterium]|nr:heavy metal-binding domain-containing protein [Desulfobacterales bacterium]